ncbi:PhzF family phenazine biosynthesis protein [Achromobacter sp. K91]|uniref:PhzF family phenazine biosynthesis protein n=1 Tax=Achromobacter TaxID=222 RepID=UPI000E6741C3|nr:MULTISPECIES: PhzF family phenazine biosynthesis protein [Achromobacter]MBD9419564.1 PhzF family phenazine biosynthesis protein [Achromobacter sp. ACM04]MBD9476823.1 PhzF family phenazine biosynthesis protein [Achromobacter sp. ACM01]MDQ1761432.1 PhzF family phenazine biosynthesis protein [Achromobacter aegrifaciens]RIJ03857.1 PhzF family phenazine biosynthesis protein [Achromobacter sp. K91]CAB3683789.1 putative isomerase YddE [Achromobacter aegrifaciens]
MPQLDIYQVDAFTAAPFGGNPAAVVPLQAWLPDETLQRIAEENNLSETAYFVRKGDVYELRWFTPAVEVDLCGHATLASAWVLFEQLGATEDVLRFATRSGELQVRRASDRLAMDFPAKRPEAQEIPPGLLQALGLPGAQAFYKTDDYLVVIDDETRIDALKPDFAALAAFETRGVAVTAPSAQFDFVTRWFGPRVGVNEDPVTGSAHTSLAPYWAQRLGKRSLSAQQGGARKGQLQCEVLDNGRVIISGQAALYLRGSIFI